MRRCCRAATMPATWVPWYSDVRSMFSPPPGSVGSASRASPSPALATSETKSKPATRWVSRSGCAAIPVSMIPMTTDGTPVVMSHADGQPIARRFHCRWKSASLGSPRGKTASRARRTRRRRRRSAATRRRAPRAPACRRARRGSSMTTVPPPVRRTNRPPMRAASRSPEIDARTHEQAIRRTGRVVEEVGRGIVGRPGGRVRRRRRRSTRPGPPRSSPGARGTSAVAMRSEYAPSPDAHVTTTSAAVSPGSVNVTTSGLESVADAPSDGRGRRAEGGEVEVPDGEAVGRCGQRQRDHLRSVAANAEGVGRVDAREPKPGDARLARDRHRRPRLDRGQDLGLRDGPVGFVLRDHRPRLVGQDDRALDVARSGRSAAAPPPPPPPPPPHEPPARIARRPASARVEKRPMRRARAMSEVEPPDASRECYFGATAARDAAGSDRTWAHCAAIPSARSVVGA